MTAPLSVARACGLVALAFALHLAAMPSASAQTATVRGRVDVYNPYAGRAVPTAGEQVVLLRWGNGWAHTGTAYTDPYGFYYFDARPGRYRVQVRDRWFVVDVPARPARGTVVDVPPLLLR